METAVLKQDLIAETVRNWIIGGKYSPGQKLPTDVELANQFQVNKCTVAAGLNQLVEEKLLERAPRRGSVVRRQEKMLCTNAVALITKTQGEMYSKFTARINRELLKRDLYPVLMDEGLNADYDEVIKFMRQLIKKSHPYGSLILGDHIPYEELKKSPYCLFKTVFLLRYHYFEEFRDAYYALSDYEDMGRQIVQYFAERNIKRILFPATAEIKFRGNWASMQVTLLEHIKNYARREGLEVDDSLFWRMHCDAPADAVLPDAIRSSKVPTGIFAFSDSFLAARILPIIRNMGMDPQKDFAILGNFNTEQSEMLGFDTFDHRVEEIAEIGVRMLTGEITEKKILLPPQLIHRSNK